jgi:EAL domain-containing protein (putative c-di-GMP-specific phosphodiesterase class I)
LVRWRHPRKGLLTPASFLTVAENTGLLRTIDACVIDQVAGTAAGWAKAGIDFGRIAVNISAASFTEPDFVHALRERLDRAGMAPHHLTIEVVESIFISERAGGVVGKLDLLRGMGVRIELDDFGTGYAALAHLRAFKVDGIKLDRSFVGGLGVDREDEVITSAIVGLARNLGIGCVAEGIETERQARFLEDLGCESGQGHLFGAPGDEAAATALLRRMAVSTPNFLPA